MHNLRMAFRSLSRTPVATTLIVCLLGLGLGAAATIFSLFDAVLLRPLPVAHPEQLVRLVQQMPKLPPRSSFPYPFYAALRDHVSTLQFVFGETDDGVHLRMTEPSSEQISVHAVTPEFFTALGVKPYWGRMLLNEDHAAVISYQFWRKHFPDDPKTLAGKTLVVNGQRLAIVGVMPREFNGLSADTSPDIRIPLNDYFLLTGYPRDKQFFELSARLKPGQTESSAQSECLALWNSAMRDYYLNTDKESSQSTAALLKRGLYLEPLAHGTSVLRDRMGDVLKLLMAAAAVLVLIIGLNVAGLLVAPHRRPAAGDGRQIGHGRKPASPGRAAGSGKSSPGDPLGRGGHLCRTGHHAARAASGASGAQPLHNSCAHHPERSHQRPRSAVPRADRNRDGGHLHHQPGAYRVALAY